VRIRARASIRLVAALIAATSALAACSATTTGKGSVGSPRDADLTTIGDSFDPLDTRIKNALSDVITFWKVHYPDVSGGKSLPAIKGGFFSIDAAEVVDTGKVSGPAAKEACVAEDPAFIVDNAAYCTADDSIVWDRNADHLIGALAKKFGPMMLALAFAHEFGHAIQKRLGIFGRDVPVIDTESQADCAAGAFLADVVAGRATHFRTTAAQLDRALNGYLQVRDTTPSSSRDISHGNGFDRLSAIDDGLRNGPKFCYDRDYFDRQFTERPFVSDSDYQTGGNESLEQVLDPRPTQSDGSGGGGLQPDLNRFWAAAAKSAGKTWKSVTIVQADHPECDPAGFSEFGYCPGDNTVYYSPQFAAQAYNSLAELRVDPDTGNVTVAADQPADFALGTLFAVGWGMAVRHQLFNRPLDNGGALTAAICYTGAYAKDANVGQTTTPRFVLSPPDMDEATSAMLNLVGLDTAYGARGTSGLQRIRSFVRGYQGGLSVC
jgi:predicted metalloprotease